MELAVFDGSAITHAPLLNAVRKRGRHACVSHRDGGRLFESALADSPHTDIQAGVSAEPADGGPRASRFVGPQAEIA